MSNVLLNWTFEQDIKPSAKLVLLSLANRANEEHGFRAWPSREQIARDTTMSVRSVQRQLNWLAENGYIIRCKRRSSKSRHFANIYSFPSSAILALKQNSSAKFGKTQVPIQAEMGDRLALQTKEEPKEEPKARGITKNLKLKAELSAWVKKIQQLFGTRSLIDRSRWEKGFIEAINENIDLVRFEQTTKKLIALPGRDYPVTPEWVLRDIIQERAKSSLEHGSDFPTGDQIRMEKEKGQDRSELKHPPVNISEATN